MKRQQRKCSATLLLDIFIIFSIFATSLVILYEKIFLLDALFIFLTLEDKKMHCIAYPWLKTMSTIKHYHQQKLRRENNGLKIEKLRHLQIISHLTPNTAELKKIFMFSVLLTLTISSNFLACNQKFQFHVNHDTIKEWFSEFLSPNIRSCRLYNNIVLFSHLSHFWHHHATNRNLKMIWTWLENESKVFFCNIYEVECDIH